MQGGGGVQQTRIIAPEGEYASHLPRDHIYMSACIIQHSEYYCFYQVFPVGPVWPHWRPRVGIIQHSRTVMPIYRVTLGGASKALLGKIANLNKNFRVGTPAPWP
jgi:hypothetical protein